MYNLNQLFVLIKTKSVFANLEEISFIFMRDKLDRFL